MILDSLNLNSIKDLLPDKPKFNFMDVFRIGKSELAHSNFISHVLKENHNGISGAKVFFDILKKHNVIAEDIDCSNFNVHRERHNIDILIECHEKSLIVAIENKLYSPESDGQLKRYQDLLNNKYNDNDSKYLLFLTPSGKNALTADENNHQVPCIPISYEIIVEFIEALIESADIDEGKAYKVFLEIIKDHLEVNIVTNKELKKEAYKIWGDPEQRKLLNIINENRPNLGHIKDSYINKVKQHLFKAYDDELLVTIYPGKGIPKEVKIRSKYLSEKDINICYMLFDYETNDYPCFRVVISKEDYYKRVEAYDKVAEVLNDESLFAKIDSIPGWGYWMSLLLEDNSQPDHNFEHKHEYDDDFAVMAFEEFKKQYDKVNGLLYKKF